MGINPLEAEFIKEYIKQNDSLFKLDDTVIIVSGKKLQVVITAKQSYTISFITELSLLSFVDRLLDDPVTAYHDFLKEKPRTQAYSWRQKGLK